MDQNINTAQNESAPEVTKQEDTHVHARDRKVLFITITVLVVGLLTAWFIFFYDKKEAEMQYSEGVVTDLKKSSLPVETTVEERGVELEGLSEQSEPVKTTEDERLNQLNSLRQ